jgi:hypothetical protein
MLPGPFGHQHRLQTRQDGRLAFGIERRDGGYVGGPHRPHHTRQRCPRDVRFVAVPRRGHHRHAHRQQRIGRCPWSCAQTHTQRKRERRAHRERETRTRARTHTRIHTYIHIHSTQSGSGRDQEWTRGERTHRARGLPRPRQAARPARSSNAAMPWVRPVRAVRSQRSQSSLGTRARPSQHPATRAGKCAVGDRAGVADAHRAAIAPRVCVWTRPPRAPPPPPPGPHLHAQSIRLLLPAAPCPSAYTVTYNRVG